MKNLVPTPFLAAMEPDMKKLIHSVLLLTLLASVALSQDLRPTNPGLDGSKSAISPHIPAQSSITLPSYESPKRPGHHTAADWRALIDSLWGPGPPTATKLQIFDTFWNLIDRQYAGFPYLDVNWDSLKAVYRPEIEAGVSRGRLWGILGHMYLSLQEIHTWIADLDLDSYFMEGGQLVYRPGMPVFFPSGWGWAGSFGAALTPMPDSSLLVYRALSPHPLGIVAGDVVLGYDGIPWKQLYHELLSVEFPLEWWGETRFGSSPRSMSHALLNSAGSNWGLFDTLDVVKYATGDTVHLPTASLVGSDYLSLFATEQLPIPGVRMPDYRGGERVTWGVVDGTSIGYVYVYRWNSSDAPAFAAAMRDLVTVRKVAGLILDFRYNIGSDDSWDAANPGLDYLFNEDPAGPSRWQSATRSSPTDHFGFSFSGPPGSFQPGPEFYDRPIAVLTGPQAWSLGDHVSFRMRSHPMARFFGLPTNGAFVMGGGNAGPIFGNWYYSYAGGQMQSFVNNEGFLMHKSFPVDEEVWLTQDGVAKGDDDVVERAIEWIGTLSHAHDVRVSRLSIDTIHITARVENPLAHSLGVVARLADGSGALIDSVYLADDGLHGDSTSGDGFWGCRYVPSSENLIRVTVRTEDVTTGTARTLPNAVTYLFTRGAMISADTRAVDFRQIDISLSGRDTTFMVRNIGFATDSIEVSLNYGNVTPDSAIAVSPVLFELAAGDSSGVTFMIRPQLLVPQYYSAVVRMHSRLGYGQTLLSKPMLWQIVVTGLVPESDELPKVFMLEQNYPNPFNPSTTITYTLPHAARVNLKVFNTLGQEVAALLNEDTPAGVHTVHFDAARLPSGVYLYRLTAGSFVQTRKMIIMK